MEIRPYDPADETGWVRCRVLAFLVTAYYDDVRRTKERYENPAVELVAVDETSETDGRIVGLVDVELDTEDRQVCSDRPGRGGMVWHLAVHPDYQRQGVATALTNAACDRARGAGVDRIEAWTRDDTGTVAWYEAAGFEQADSYLHVYLDREEASRDLAVVDERPALDGLSVDSAFAQYVGDDEAAIRERYDRVHDCRLFVKSL